MDRARTEGRDDAVWQALDRFSEALRNLDEEVRALAQVFDRPRDIGGPPESPPGRITQPLE